MRGQLVIDGRDGYGALERYLLDSGAARVFLVCGSSIRYLALDKFFRDFPRRTGIQVTRFSGFQPNPTYESVAEGVNAFQAAGCDLIAAVGGGSAIDVAKCVKLFSGLDPKRNYLEQEPRPNGVKLLAIPTTAGSGSEATQFAVIYQGSEKKSVESEACLPDAVLLDPVLLPDIQRKCTMLDALCHALESFWCINADDRSRTYSRRALQMILGNLGSYLRNVDTGNAAMQRAAYTAGQAINLTRTTAGHAMAYGLTARYGIPHGYAAALCVAKLWPYMLSRADAGLEGVFQDIAEAMGCQSPEEAVRRYTALLEALDLERPAAREEDIPTLCSGVNAQRLKNNPVELSAEAIEAIYRQILL